MRATRRQLQLQLQLLAAGSSSRDWKSVRWLTS
jgi:hypothetical protein